jgi:hypothetical protein
MGSSLLYVSMKMEFGENPSGLSKEKFKKAKDINR